MPRINSRVYGYTADGGSRFEGIYRGKRKAGAGYTIKVYKIIELDDGTIYETTLPIYKVQ